jgi:hypothetical protein
LEPPSSDAIASSAGKSYVEGREAEWEGEGVLITCASRSLSGLLSIPIAGATYDWGDVTPRFTSTNKELGRQSHGFQKINYSRLN